MKREKKKKNVEFDSSVERCRRMGNFPNFLLFPSSCVRSLACRLFFGVSVSVCNEEAIPMGGKCVYRYFISIGKYYMLCMDGGNPSRVGVKIEIERKLLRQVYHSSKWRH